MAKNSFTLIEEAYNEVRWELEELGLLADGVYLDEISLVVRMQHLLNRKDNIEGFVFDSETPWFSRLIGFRKGTIYINEWCGQGILKEIKSTIRHEFGHAWAWLDRGFFERGWFSAAFGGDYHAAQDEMGKLFSICCDDSHFKRWGLDRLFVSTYAMTQPKEDFAETFALYLAQKGKVGKMSHRPGVRKKLLAIHRAVREKAKELRSYHRG
jgi:hypothetical protein